MGSYLPWRLGLPASFLTTVQWTSITPPTAERNVLNFVPHLREATPSSSTESLDRSADPFGLRVWRSRMVELSGQNRALNEFSVERLGEQADETLVMLHGYGAGLGFFYKNFEPLTRAKGWRLFALDLLGMGNSVCRHCSLSKRRWLTVQTRPPFRVHAKDPQGKVTEAENWFIDALEEWRIKSKIEQFTLMGHSMGGYLAVSYALKYPGRLKKLILASPVGVPENPYATPDKMQEQEESTMAAEFTVDQETVMQDHNNFLNQQDKTTKGGRRRSTSSTGTPKRPLPGWLVWLWDANVSPFSIVRLTGPFGPRFVSGWTSRRFNHLPPDEAQALHDYSFAIFRQRGSGEYALPYILAPGAYARSPIVHRIHKVGRQVLRTEGDTPVRETGIPIVMMYGENDWMDVAGGLAAEEKLKQAKMRVLLHGTPREKREERGGAKVVVIAKAGHHLYLDNPADFNEAILKEMEETRAESRRRA
jgi:cardiolipin-specific phospholipase